MVKPFLGSFLNYDFVLYLFGGGVTKLVLDKSSFFPYPRDVVLVALVVGMS